MFLQNFQIWKPGQDSSERAEVKDGNGESCMIPSPGKIYRMSYFEGDFRTFFFVLPPKDCSIPAYLVNQFNNKKETLSNQLFDQINS